MKQETWVETYENCGECGHCGFVKGVGFNVGSYVCKKTNKPISNIWSDIPEWCPLEDIQNETGR